MSASSAITPALSYLLHPYSRDHAMSELKNLVSTILSLIAHQLPAQWEDRYSIRSVLLETFINSERFTGTCYKAANEANWIYVGKNQRA